MRDLHVPSVDEVKALSRAQMVSALVGGAVAAVVYAPNRLLAGALGAAAMVMFFVHRGPCCADCAGASVPAQPIAATRPATGPGAPYDGTPIRDTGGLDESPCGRGGCQ